MFSNATLSSDLTPQDQKTLLIIKAQSVFDKIKDVTSITDINSLLDEDPVIKMLLLGGTHTFENGDTMELSVKMITAFFKIMIKVGNEINALRICENNKNIIDWLSNKLAHVESPTLAEIKDILRWQINSAQREIKIIKALGNNTRLELAFEAQHLPFDDAIKLFGILIQEKLSHLAFTLWRKNKEIQDWYFGRPRGMKALQESELRELFISLLNIKSAKLLIALWQNNIVLHRSILENYLFIIRTVTENTTKKTLPFFNVFINDIQDVNSLEQTLNWLTSETGIRKQSKMLLCRDIIKLRIQAIKAGPKATQVLNGNNNNRNNSSVPRTLISYETKQILEQLAVDIETNQIEKVRITTTTQPFLMKYLAGALISVYNKSEQGPIALQLTRESSLKYFTKFIEWQATDLIRNFWNAASPEVKSAIAGDNNEQIAETEIAYQVFKTLLVLKLSDIALYLFKNKDHLKKYIIQKLSIKEVSIIFGKAVQQKNFSLAYSLWTECPAVKQGICTAKPPADVDALSSLLSFISALESGNLHDVAATIKEESIVIKTYLSSTLKLPKINQLNSHLFFYISASAFNELKSLVNVDNLTDTIGLDVQTRGVITYVKVTILDENKYTDLLTFIVEAQIKSRFSETVELIAQYVSTDTNVEITPSDESNENRSIVNLFEENIALPEELLNILTDSNPVSEMHTAADDVLANDICIDETCEPEPFASVKPKSPSQSPTSPSLYGFGYGYQNDSFRLPHYQPINENSTEEQANKRMKLGE